MLKKIGYTFLVILTLIIGLMILVPYLYQDEIKEILKEEINKSVTGTVDFEDLSLSLFRHFPDLSIGIDKLLLTEGKDSTMGDTIAYSDEITVSVDLMTILRKEETVKVNGIYLIQPYINLTVSDSGQANYDIIISQEDTEEMSNTDAAVYSVQLENYEIQKAKISYHDQQSGMTFFAPEFSHSGSGSYQGSILDLTTTSSSPLTSFNYDGTSYLNKANIDWLLDLTIDLAQGQYSIEKSDLHLNDLTIAVEGFVNSIENGYDMDLTFEAPGNDFGELWSAIPAQFKASYEDVKTAGQFSLSGAIQGSYLSSTNQFPKVEVSALVNNGSVAYNALPQSLSNINADIKYLMPEGSNRQMINVKGLSLNAGQSTFSMKGDVNQNGNDTYIDGFLKSNLNLKDIPQDAEYSGKVLADIEFKGSLSDINQQNYDALTLSGTAAVQNIKVKMNGYPALDLQAEQINFSPKQVESPSFSLRIGESDVNGNMVLIDPLGFLSHELNPQLTLTLQSKKLNIDELMQNEGGSSESNTEDVQEVITSLLPYGISVDVAASIDEVVYSPYDIKSLNGRVRVKEQAIDVAPTALVYSGHPLNIEGQLDRVADYVYNQGSIKGQLKISAKKFDLNQFMSDGSVEDPNAQVNDAPSEVFVLPDNMDITLETDIQSVDYDTYTLENLQGSLSLSDQQVDLTQMTTQVFGGQMGLIGTFKSDGQQAPQFSFKYDISSMPFEGVYKNILSIKQLAPLAQYLEGIFNSTLIVEGRLLDNMMPDLTTISASGYIETLKGQLGKLPFLEKLSNKLAVSSLSGMSIEDTKNWFEIKDGEFRLEPFSYTYQDIGIDVSGKTGLDKSLDLDLKLSIPREKIDKIPGGDAVGKGLDWATNEIGKLGFKVDEVSMYVFGVDILGAIDNPAIKIKMLDAKGGTGNPLKQAGQNLKEQLTDTLQKEKEKLINETKDKLEEETQKVKDSIQTRLEEEKKKAEERIKEELEKKAKEALDSAAQKKLKEKAEEVIGEDAEKKIEDLKNKLDEFNPFKKKKK